MLSSSARLNTAPIGVFDSGMGGLAVARYLQQYLPQEDFIFFGDTAHLPYGDRDSEELLVYTKAIIRFLTSRDIKALVVACNTVSTVAGDWLRNNLDIPVVNVIDPIAKRLSGVYSQEKRVGLVGTKVTVNSGVYKKRIRSYGGHFDFKAWAIPELVPMIESSKVDYDAILQLLEGYAKRLAWSQLDGLILGCTHYPWVYKQFRSVLGDGVDLWDAGAVTAEELRAQLTQYHLLTTGGASKVGNWCFYLSDTRKNMHELIANFWQSYDIKLVSWQLKGDAMLELVGD